MNIAPERVIIRNPKKANILPILPTIAILAILLIIKLKASLAALQKLLPVNAI